MPDRDSEKVLLIGAMGAGKSTIGRRLAKDLGWSYIDNDEEISRLSGLSPQELAGLPVSELHELESDYLSTLQKHAGPFVAGVPASVVDSPLNVEILKSMTSVYLRIPIEQAVSRAGSVGIGRGNIEGDVKQVLTERFLRRDPIYQEVARLTIELGNNKVADSKKIQSYISSL